MLTTQDFNVLANRFRVERPKDPGDPCTKAQRKLYERNLETWTKYRDLVAVACGECNPRFKRDLFIRETER